MKEENRRSFVKKSLATSMTFSFSGLIRAHGEEGGSTTVATTEETTVFNADDTTFATTETTDSGGTTVWDPDGTTLETTILGETTWNPEDTTVETTEETTVVTTTPPSRVVLTSILVEFTGTADRPMDPNIKVTDPGWWRWSGRVFTGTLTYYLKNCFDGSIEPVVCSVKSGGYDVSVDLKGGTGMPSKEENIGTSFWSDKPWLSGSDTSWPPGTFLTSTSFHEGQVAGYYVIPSGEISMTIDERTCKRTYMKLHYKERPNGSAGCIVFESSVAFETFKKWMDERKSGCAKIDECGRAESGEIGRSIGCLGIASVPMLVKYDEVLLPLYKLRDGTILQPINPSIPIVIPAD